MIDAVKTAAAFHIYLAPGVKNSGLAEVLAELGLEGRTLSDPESVLAPALILLAPGEAAPEGLEDSAIRPPADMSAAALRELLRIALRDAVRKQENGQLEELSRRQHRQFEELNRIGIALSAERDIGKLQEFILTTMRQLTNADGASLWLKTVDEGEPRLRLSSSQNDSIDADTYQSFTVLVDEKTVVGYTVTKGTSQIYDDAYNPPPGKPPGGRGFDAQYGYRTKSMLTVPMRDYNNEVVGAIQLINAKRRIDTKLTIDSVDQEVVSFRPEDLEMLESVASQAAVTLDNKTLLDEIQKLFDGLVNASVIAIEQRDPATRGHSERVERLTTGIALAVNQIEVGKYREVRLSDDRLKELKYACLLHDFGKVGVHEDILVKAKKLIPGQLELIRERFENAQWSRWADYLFAHIETLRRDAIDPSALKAIPELQQLRSWFEAVAAANEPTVLPEEKASMIEALSSQTYVDIEGNEHPLLAPQEFRFLKIPKGTLDDDERLEIESHVTHSFNILRKMPWPRLMKDLPNIAYSHHEKLDGSGYPRGLTESEIPLQAKMMTIADIYDALTAQDRPYKKAVPVDRAIDILHAEAGAGKLDRDLLDVFTAKRIFELTAVR